MAILYLDVFDNSFFLFSMELFHVLKWQGLEIWKREVIFLYVLIVNLATSLLIRRRALKLYHIKCIKFPKYILTKQYGLVLLHTSFWIAALAIHMHTTYSVSSLELFCWILWQYGQSWFNLRFIPLMISKGANRGVKDGAVVCSTCKKIEAEGRMIKADQYTLFSRSRINVKNYRPLVNLVIGVVEGDL